MEDWLASVKATSKSSGGSDLRRILSGQHNWHATSHARPTYCNVCQEQLSGVTSHGFSCEICKCKVHKRCLPKTISNCKWTTLASVGKDIIEDKHGNILMPHQWMEGNLPVSAKCAVCEKTCGSVLRIQDWRCLWCRAAVHTACRPKHSIRCPLGPNHVSVVPPTAIHSVGMDDTWEAVRPHGSSPLLVFVNSKSGDNQGVKFLRRFRQILNPAQVFDLIIGGPSLGLRLFQNFHPFRVLVCSGDGSVGWVLSEIDRLNMQGQCEVGVLPLGTGNDLARILGWGASCDDDTHVSQLVERYERASPKILDRWSVMVYERSIKVGSNLMLNPSRPNFGAGKRESLAVDAGSVTAYEDSLLSHLTNILQSDQHGIVLSSAAVICETVKDFISNVSDISSVQGDEDFSLKCMNLKAKLDHLLSELQDEQIHADAAAEREKIEALDMKITTDLPKMQSRKDQLLLRVNSLKKAVRRVVEHTEKTLDEHNFQQQNLLTPSFPSTPSSRSLSPSRNTVLKLKFNKDGTTSLLTPPSNSYPSLGTPTPSEERRHSTDDNCDIFAVSSRESSSETHVDIKVIRMEENGGLSKCSHYEDGKNKSFGACEELEHIDSDAEGSGGRKESENSFCAFNPDSDCDATNLISTSPDEEECSEEYRREMGLEWKRCSIAHFIEGSDIARKSVKCRHRKKSADDLDKECIAAVTTTTDEKDDSQPEKAVPSSSPSPLPPEINVCIASSYGNLASSAEALSRPRSSCTTSDVDEGEKFGLLVEKKDGSGPTVVVDPPSPPDHFDDEDKCERCPRRLSNTCRRLSAASPLSIHSPSPSRRISNISLGPDPLNRSKESLSKQMAKMDKSLPIINPLVRLPQWPNISEPGMVGKVLLANADALCAAAVPLMDPDDVLREGFFEKCVMNNYFGIGIDAKITLDFHQKREEHPEKCRSRTRNFMWYGVLGSKEWLQKTYKNLEQRVQLECDGHRIPLPSLQGIVILNIPSFMGGTNFWGGTKEDDIFLAPSIDDRILEVVAVFGTMQMAASRLINLQHHRIAQCSSVQINIMGDEGVPIQVDGEAWIQPPGMIQIIHKNRVKMLCRNKILENSLKSWEEKRRQIRYQNRLQSCVGKLSALTEEEMNILLAFIEAATSLIKNVKLLIIRLPSIEADLYEMAAAVGLNLERVHPNGKLLQGLELRAVVTELVISTQRLQEETMSLLQDKNVKIPSEIAAQLNNAATQMEIELKKCVFTGTYPHHSLVYFQLCTTPDEEKKRERKGSAFWQRFRRGSGSLAPRFTRREVSSWGVVEVGSWLESLQMGEYAEEFCTNDIRGRELLTLTRRDLKDLGITKVGHVKRVLLALKEFA